MKNKTNFMGNNNGYEQLQRLSNILKGLSLEEELRLFKIVAEMLKINAISLGFLQRLFQALQEVDVDYDPPDELNDLVFDFLTIKCDVEQGRRNINQYVEDIERVLNKIKI